MDVRFDILRIDGVWTLTNSGPEVQAFASEQAARAAAIAVRATTRDPVPERPRFIFGTVL